MTGGYIGFAINDARVVLSGLADVARDAPDELVLMPWLSPAGDEIGGGVGVGVAYAGAPEDAERALAPIRGLAAVVEDDVEPRSYLEVQAMNGRLPFGLRHYWKGHFLADLDTAAIDAITGRLDGPGGSSGVLLEALSGTARRLDPDSAAFAARAARWNVSALAVWDDPAEDETQIAWARGVADALAPSSLAGGGYVNYMQHDEPPERALAAYGPERTDRLRAVKRRYDPENRFRFNLNVAP